MGLAIDKEHFEDDEYDRFGERLARGLTALDTLLSRPGFGVGESSLGAELEVALVGDDARPLPINHLVLRDTLDPRMTFELNQFNLECNLRHPGLAGRPFSFLGREMRDAFAELERAAGLHGARIAMIGILPTLVPADLQSSAMTDSPRYRALSRALHRGRDEPFALCIDGDDPLEIECDDVTFEGAATSLQIHLRVSPSEFGRYFNGAQLATAPVLAVAANSPTLLGHRLWHETRVALFKQAVDDRVTELERLRRRARVSFGSGWNREGVLEGFREAVDHFAPLLPVLDDEDPVACAASGGVPRLAEIRLHQSTVWSWNRPVYDPADGGHVRIELRALPAGPTIADMTANAAFLIGLAAGLSHADACWASPEAFGQAHSNFYRAAQSGLDADLEWPEGTEVPAGRYGARELVERLLPVAERGLAECGIDPDEAREQLDVIAARCATGQTGAVWQRAALAVAERRSSRSGALARMLEAYLEASASGEPVHRWAPLA